MRKLWLVLLIAFSNGAISATSPLKPADDPLCIAYCQSGNELEQCLGNKILHMTLDGRCGCLAPGQYSSAFICLNSNIKCPAQTELVNLYRYVSFAGQMVTAYTGCGCFVR